LPSRPRYLLGAAVERLYTLPDGGFRLATRDAAAEARAIIIAPGVGAFGPNRAPLADIEAYEGTSIFYLVTRREQLRGKRIVIAGGGDSAIDWALALEGVTAHIMLVHRRAKFRTAPESARRLERLAAHAIHPLLHPGEALHFEYSTVKGVPGRR
jgi:thioredoxin reductase (NADPH)